MAPHVRMHTTIALVAALCLVYVVSQFMRNSLGVIAPDIARDLGLVASHTGFLSSAFFFAFAAAQIPVGVALDHYGPKKVMLVCCLITLIGSALFALAQDFWSLAFARILLGLGCSSLFMGPLTLYARWYGPQQFSTLVGVQLGTGTLGSLIATVPLAQVSSVFGWRMAFLMMAGVVGVVMGILWLVVRDYPKGAVIETHHESLSQRLKGLREVVQTPDVWRLFFMHFATYSTFVTLLGLWGGPYLAHVYGYDLEARGNTLFVMAGAQVIGFYIWGPMDKVFSSYKYPVVLGALGVCALLIWLAVQGKVSQNHLLIWFAGFGGFAACSGILTAHGKAIFANHLTGRGITFLNMATMGGVFTLQWLTGLLFDAFGQNDGVYGLEAYQFVFGMLAVWQLVALALYLPARDPRRMQTEKI